MFEFIVVQLCYIDISSGKSTGSHNAVSSVSNHIWHWQIKLWILWMFVDYEIMHAKWV